MDFIAVDVETANADLSSICQIGLAAFEKGVLRRTWSTLIDPEDFFDGLNISIHGIDEDRIAGAPTFVRVFETLSQFTEGAVVASHTPFDRLALARACERYRLPELACTWLDTARVVRRAWQKWASSGYGLTNVAEGLGISYVPHDAEEDARAAGAVLLAAVQETGLSITDWLERVRRPIGSESGSGITRTGNVEGPLFGEVAVFTGALSIPRREAADLAAVAGCDVANSVTQSTTLLVVGDQDVRKLAGHQKSSKHRKAEKLIAAGQQIKVLSERRAGPHRGSVSQDDVGRTSEPLDPRRPPSTSLAWTLTQRIPWL